MSKAGVVSKSGFDPGFATGWNAFCSGIKPLDNPHFAVNGEVDLFDSWSDGWLSARDAGLPKKDRMLTQLRKSRDGKPAWWTRNDLIGITSTWSIRPANV